MALITNIAVFMVGMIFFGMSLLGLHKPGK